MFNCLMHPRNQFKTNPPNFKDLAKKYSFLKDKCYLGVGGKVCVDFKNPKAVTALSRALLLEYFGLSVQFPEDSLVPRIPQRLNYILLIEDLLRDNNLNNDSVCGIDIGTGASCIFPLLGAKQCEWNFVATELDEISLNCARENAVNNGLSRKIILVSVGAETIFEKVMEEFPERVFEFCMCNPPFFDPEEGDQRFLSSPDVNTMRNRFTEDGKLAPRSATLAKHNEVFVRGGEVAFVTRIINESYRFKDRIRIFTTMIGRRSSISPLQKMLTSSDLNVSVSVYALSQGRTQRWHGSEYQAEQLSSRRDLNNLVSSACSQKDSDLVERLLSRADTIFLDESFMEVLRFIARIDSTAKKCKLFELLLKKNFTAASLRMRIEEYLSVEEAIQILKLAMDVILKSSINESSEFENSLELCSILLGCYYQKFVWYKGSTIDELTELLTPLAKMIEISTTYTGLIAIAQVRKELPGLFASPRSDYYVEKIEMESIEL
ncbi:methyltransferase small domain-containing protein [Ditylenchus destructor]|uniref:Methyltransferase small domain-containing protein n=1 Tax=Ditylenchus destructor TaxID=166010 RepID=A0AAD4N9H9_9BILA|nr:methyltransferase small domain-containing protein [Ditylenchus destructor]